MRQSYAVGISHKSLLRTGFRSDPDAITDLDLDTWDEKRDSAVNSKCYLTLDVDFKWFNDNDKFVPIVSGGSLALSNTWWKQTGGYDEQMRGWGGDNLDQSLRSWLMKAPSTVLHSTYLHLAGGAPAPPRPTILAS